MNEKHEYVIQHLHGDTWIDNSFWSAAEIKQALAEKRAAHGWFRTGLKFRAIHRESREYILFE